MEPGEASSMVELRCYSAVAGRLELFDESYSSRLLVPWSDKVAFPLGDFMELGGIFAEIRFGRPSGFFSNAGTVSPN